MRALGTIGFLLLISLIGAVLIRIWPTWATDIKFCEGWFYAALCFHRHPALFNLRAVK